MPGSGAAIPDDASDGPTRSEVGEDYWDPPCRICKKVDDEANVLCELCNGAYHLACIANIKPPLPRSPEDNEWFCRGCVKRGVPEAILDRVGRQSSAHYLVKWLGYPPSEVSWLSAAALDTAWSRKIIRQYVEEIEPTKCDTRQLLPACHPLVDTLRAVADERAAAAAGCCASSPGHASAGDAVRKARDHPPPSADAMAAGTQLLTCVRTLASRVPHSHPLSGLARQAARLCRVTNHPRCAALEPWVAAVDPAGERACAAVARAATLVSEATGALESSLGPIPSPDGSSTSVSDAADERGRGGKSPVRKKARNSAARTAVAAGALSAGSASASSTALSTTIDCSAPTAALIGLLAELSCRAEPAPAHVLAPVALAASRGLILLEHPEWSGAHCKRQAAIAKAEKALTDLRASLDELLGTPPAAAATAASAASATAACTPNAFRSFLLYLKENIDRIRAAHADAPPREIERMAAIEYGQLSEEAKEEIDKRALKIYTTSVATVPPALAGIARRGNAAGGGVGGDKAAGGGGGSRRRNPCTACGESDKRDSLVCTVCNCRLHLMCSWPPLESAPAEAWTCDACRSSVPPLRKVPTAGEELQAEVQESPANGGGVVWKRAVVLKSLPRDRFVLMINPDEEDDFIEEYGMEDEGTEWRRSPAATEALIASRAAAEKEKEVVAKEQAAAAEELAKEMVVQSSHPAAASLSPVELSLVEEMYRDGMCILEQGITEEQVEAAEDVVESGYKHYMHSVKTLDLQEKLQDVGFYEIKMRSAGRYDLQLPELSTASFSFLTTGAPWMPLIHAILGSDAVLTHFGCMLSFPGSAVQPWHTDGPHIRGCGEAGAPVVTMDGPSGGGGGGSREGGGGDEDEEAKDIGKTHFIAPVHAINVFVPLVDLTADKGPTEFVPGSHVDFDIQREHRIATVKAGSAILFDYRLKHRGLGNRSQEDRPLLYITYSRVMMTCTRRLKPVLLDARVCSLHAPRVLPTPLLSYLAPPARALAWVAAVLGRCVQL